jgi:hypothetical protein
MADHEDLVPLTEPLIVSCLFVNGLAIQPEDGAIRFVGWVYAPNLGGQTEERRIVVRFAMPLHAAREMFDTLRKVLNKGQQ